jgi:hypothetical protein
MFAMISRRVRSTDRDAGFALVLVLLVMLILTTLGTAVVAQAITSLPQATHEANFSAAQGAAEAGVDDFVARLNQNYNYATSPDGNQALSTYVKVAPGSTGSYTYRVDTSKQAATGTVYLTVAGKVGKVVRTLKVGLHPRSYLDALDFDNYNIVDPSLFSSPPSDCQFYAYQHNTITGGTGPGPDCGGLLNYWVTGNTFNGPLASNDEFYINGTPVFNDTVTSGDPTTADSPYWKDPAGPPSGGDHPAFSSPPQGQVTIGLPPPVSSFLTYTATGTTTGCLYSGPTSITLNSSGTMTVVSPETAVAATNSNCLGTNVPLPADGTIYVQNSLSCGGFNVGAWQSDTCSSGDAYVQGTLAGQLTIAAANNIFISGSVKYDVAFPFSGNHVLGLVATNLVEILHPVQSSGCGAHIVKKGNCNTFGSVAFGATGVTFAVPLVNPTLDAAVLSAQHAFGVQNFDSGGGPLELGNINFNGSMAGFFMDTEGVFSSSGQDTGYGVSYTYDNRFRNGALLPPNFLSPTSTTWKRISYAEVANPAWS